MTTQEMSVSPGFAARTHVGRQRELNEDRCVADPPLFVVADGLGGHRAGEIAAQLAIDSFAGVLAGNGDPRALVLAIEAANETILKAAGRDRALDGMSTTCVAILFDETSVHVAHVGDSRAYRLRDGSLVRLTEDHTVIAAMVREGVLARDDAERDERRNVLTQALGAGKRISVAASSHMVEPGDRYLLCSDGLSGQLSDTEIQSILIADGDPGAAADDLVQRANDNGGVDNVTVVVIDPDLVNARSSTAAATLPSTPLRTRGLHRRIGRWIGAGVALVAVAALIVWQLTQSAGPATASPSPLLATPSAEATPSPEAPPVRPAAS